MMIVVLFGGDLAANDLAWAVYSSAEFKSIEADRVFGRVRRKERLHSLGRLFGFAIAKAVDTAAMDADWKGVGRAGRAMVSIDAVVGAVDPLTGVLGKLPTLKRRWKGIWRRLWAADDLDALPALNVVRGADGWYLADLPKSVVLLEILRAKGVREVRISRVPANAEASSVNVEPSYRLVEHELDYHCRDYEESRAV